MRVSARHPDATLRMGGTGLRRTKSPGGAAFEPCSTQLVMSFGTTQLVDGRLERISGSARNSAVARYDWFASRTELLAGMT